MHCKQINPYIDGIFHSKINFAKLSNLMSCINKLYLYSMICVSLRYVHYLVRVHIQNHTSYTPTKLCRLCWNMNKCMSVCNGVVSVWQYVYAFRLILWMELYLSGLQIYMYIVHGMMSLNITVRYRIYTSANLCTAVYMHLTTTAWEENNYNNCIPKLA